MYSFFKVLIIVLDNSDFALCVGLDGIISNNTSSLKLLIEESNNYQDWEEPEWGYPKGRRNPYEKDYDCAIREWTEETGFNKEHLINVQNVMPLYEIFTGSNYKSYKHKYFLMYMDYKNTENLNNYQKFQMA